MKCLSLILMLFLLLPVSVLALEPEEVIVVANHFVEESVDLARYYMKQRGIPSENLIRIDTTEKESCSREDYDEDIAKPVRKFLQKRKDPDAIRCLVTISGVPLKVGPPGLTKDEKIEKESLQSEQATIRAEMKKLTDQQGPESKRLKDQLAAIEAKIKGLSKSDQGAAVDSELALVLADDYSLKGWVPNPFFAGFQNQALPVKKKDVRFVARLDGPSKGIVRRMIDDSLLAEASGLSGTAYFDAKDPRSIKEKLEGYAYYDNSLHLAAARVTARQRMPVVVNEKKELFQAGEAPGAALYCGWYSLARYVDAFDWRPGAVGYHIASQECQTLRSGSSNVWCKRMLEDGAAATIGPVAEPYLQAFPVPEIFFGALIDGSYTLAEAYFLSLPYLSWQMVLVGDPLYRPFKNHKMTNSQSP
ncbi:TIGR03790 family protein [Trichloromonas sp.]|uniref:TIGR03790 family protein n=1 Tax=Trichloromonas sp. TaxID=3069249 RepID=UPI003D81A7A8